MKKSAFSYLEIIIAMTLVVMIAILTAPLMTSMGKKSTPMYGEYKCYARLVDGEWRLFENQRVNTDTYPAEDNELESEAPCNFTKPAGNISSYTVVLYGGGGSGSMPYFITAKSDAINLAPGESGKSGEKKSIVDSLDKAFDTDGTMSIYLCDSPNAKKNCIGKGGEVNLAQSSVAPKERIEKIKVNLKQGGELSVSDEDYIRNSECKNNNTVINAMDNYKADKTNQIKRNTFISSLNSSCYNMIVDTTKYTGNSGQATKLMQSSGVQIIVNGGQYGSSDKYANAEDYKIEGEQPSFTNGGGKLYYIPVGSNPTISNNKFYNCDGEDANNPNDVDIFENFGTGGGAGVFACQIKNVENLNILNTKNNLEKNIYVNYARGVLGNKLTDSVENQCFEGYGGAGAGGAIVIQWN